MIKYHRQCVHVFLSRNVLYTFKNVQKLYLIIVVCTVLPISSNCCGFYACFLKKDFINEKCTCKQRQMIDRQCTSKECSRGEYRGGDFVLVAPPWPLTGSALAPPGIWRKKGKNIEIHNICRIILLQFLLRLYFPFKVNEKCGIISFYLIL